ncbi:hypothetical protein NBRC10513_007924 [Rhodotorula toruloides]
MPHSISLPFQSVLLPELSTTPPYRTLLKPDELEKVFVEVLGEEKWEKVKQGEKSVTATCGSGMTAAVLWLALQRAGVTDNTAIYDEVRLTHLFSQADQLTPLAELDGLYLATQEQDPQVLNDLTAHLSSLHNDASATLDEFLARGADCGVAGLADPQSTSP